MKRIPTQVAFTTSTDIARRPLEGFASGAFTIIELLTVVAIMTILIGLIGPVLTVMTGRNITKTLDNVSAAIDFARAEAMGKQTYVWVGVLNATASGQSATGQLQVAAVRSLDGTPNLTISGNLNYAPIAAPWTFNGAALTNCPNGIAKALSKKISTEFTVDNNAIFDLGSSPNGNNSSSFVVGKQTFGPGQIILFTPQGQAILFSGTSPSAVTPFATNILIGLCGMRGTTQIQNDPQSGVIVLYGGTGQLRTFRL